MATVTLAPTTVGAPTSPASAAATPAVSLKGWLGMAAGLTGSFMALLNTQATTFALNDIKGGIHAGFDEGAWISTAYSLGEFSIIPLTAALSVAFTTRWWLMANVLLFLVFSIACASATTLDELLLFRVGQGLTGGALIPLSFKITLSTFIGRQKPLGIAFFAVTATFTPTIGATAAGWVTEQFGWTGLFYLTLLPGMICLALAWLGLPRDDLRLSYLRQIDWIGALMLALSFGCAACVFDQGNRLDWFGSAFITQMAGLSIVFFILFIWHELTTEMPLVDLRLLLRPEFGLAILAPLILSLARRIDERVLVTFGLVLFAAGSVMNWRLTSVFARPDFLLSQLIIGIAQPFVQVPMMIIATTPVGPKDANSANVLFNDLKTVATTIAAGLVTTMITKREQFHSARLTETVTVLSSAFHQRLSAFSGKLGAAAGANGAGRALTTIATQIRAQAQTMAYADALIVIGVVLAVALIAVWLMPPPPAGSGLMTWSRSHERH
jgi:DHA2 family multidrug resistance protein